MNSVAAMILPVGATPDQTHQLRSRIPTALWFLEQAQLRMETDRIRMESDSNSTFYHILNRIRIRIRIFSDTNAKRMPRIRILIWILT